MQQKINLVDYFRNTSINAIIKKGFTKKQAEEEYNKFIDKTAQRLGLGGGPNAAGPGGSCVCPKCGHKSSHTRADPCKDKTCPKCGTKMTRDMSKKASNKLTLNKLDNILASKLNK